jgi:hypothetical protein
MKERLMSLLKTRLRDFKLSGVLSSLDTRLKYAEQKSLGYLELLELLLEDEANNRIQNSYKKDILEPNFRLIKQSMILILIIR